MLDSQYITSTQVSRSRGFSFAEVMFAVVILGIGFIMVAAIFPVAIQQTQASSDDSGSASVAREASNSIAALPLTVTNSTSTANTTAVVSGVTVTYPSTFPLLPPTVKNYTYAAGVAAPPAMMVPFVGPRFDAIKSSLILPSNPRLAYIPFYMRDNTSPVAELVVIAVATQIQSTYAAADISPVYMTPTTITTTAPGWTAGQISPATVQISGGASWLSEGCFVTVAQTTIATPQSGRTYLLGRQVQGQATPTYEMVPSDGMSEATGTGSTDDGLWNTNDDLLDAASSPLANATLNFPSTLQPTTAYAKFSFPSDSTSGRVTLSASLQSALLAATAPTGNVAPLSAASGAFLVVADDAPYTGTGITITYVQPTTPVSAMFPLNASGAVPRMNGRVFRLGAAIPADSQNPPGTYELDPAYGLSDSTVRNVSAMTVVSSTTADPAGTGSTYAADLWARVYIAGGRALSNTADPTQPYTGAAQAVAAYSTFIPVK